MREAANIAIENVDRGGGPFGAIIVRNDTIIGRGANSVTNNLDPTAHAEVMAIREACAATGSFKLEGAVLYSSCEPCPMCLAAAYWARIERIVFGCTQKDAANIGFDDAFLYQEISRPRSERTLPTDMCGRETALRSFHRWETKEDKIPY